MERINDRKNPAIFHTQNFGSLLYLIEVLRVWWYSNKILNFQVADFLFSHRQFVWKSVNNVLRSWMFVMKGTGPVNHVVELYWVLLNVAPRANRFCFGFFFSVPYFKLVKVIRYPLPSTIDNLLIDFAQTNIENLIAISTAFFLNANGFLSWVNFTTNVL